MRFEGQEIIQCPHCNVTFQHSWGVYAIGQDKNVQQMAITWMNCLNCQEPVIYLIRGEKGGMRSASNISTIASDEMLYPRTNTRPVAPEVPDEYRQVFLEACAVLPISSKSSAALSRRLLQTVLREEHNISRRSLAQEIDDFIALPNIPSHLKEAVDAIRNVGNFAAHPLKDTNTGEIVAVEPGEADWLLEVLEALFDFTFVQPKRLEARRQGLNDKLSNMGKPPLKG